MYVFGSDHNSITPFDVFYFYQISFYANGSEGLIQSLVKYMLCVEMQINLFCRISSYIRFVLNGKT